jgi:hypothetical protein
MKIYLIIIENRHVAVLILPRRDKEQAIQEARQIAEREANYHKYLINEDNINTFLYYAIYSLENDCVYVIESELK